MGLSICYELQLPGVTNESEVRSVLTELRERATKLPFRTVSSVIEIAPGDPVPPGQFGYEDITDFVRFEAATVNEFVDRDGYPIGRESDRAVVPAFGFVVAPGRESEPATFALCGPRQADDEARERGAADYGSWHWHCCCKTQYASLVSDEHLIRCHTSVVALLEEAERVGLGVDVRDETGYWKSRDTAELLRAVHEMNGIVARFAGAMHDQISSVAGVHGPVIDHPEFEHLEMETRQRAKEERDD